MCDTMSYPFVKAIDCHEWRQDRLGPRPYEEAEVASQGKIGHAEIEYAQQTVNTDRTLTSFSASMQPQIKWLRRRSASNQVAGSQLNVRS
jgi:hypothetical protein